MAGCDKPPPTPQVADLLDSILSHSHEVTEDEMVLLFQARGADFEAVCRAAGESASPLHLHVGGSGLLACACCPGRLGDTCKLSGCRQDGWMDRRVYNSRLCAL